MLPAPVTKGRSTLSPQSPSALQSRLIQKVHHIGCIRLIFCVFSSSVISSTNMNPLQPPQFFFFFPAHLIRLPYLLYCLVMSKIIHAVIFKQLSCFLRKFYIAYLKRPRHGHLCIVSLMPDLVADAQDLFDMLLVYEMKIGRAHV